MEFHNISRSKASITVLLALYIIIGESCNNTQTKKETVAPPEQPLQLQALATVEPPKNLISLKEAKTLSENYQNFRIPAIINYEASNSETDTDFRPTEFIAFDFNLLKQYMAYVEQEAQSVEVVADSLRIYLGNYGKSGHKPHKNTVFLLPAAQVDDAYGGFYINGNEAKLIRDYWTNTPQIEDAANTENATNGAVESGGGSLILNYGNGNPPPKQDF